MLSGECSFEALRGLVCPKSIEGEEPRLTLKWRDVRQCGERSWDEQEPPNSPGSHIPSPEPPHIAYLGRDPKGQPTQASIFGRAYSPLQVYKLSMVFVLLFCTGGKKSRILMNFTWPLSRSSTSSMPKVDLVRNFDAMNLGLIPNKIWLQANTFQRPSQTKAKTNGVKQTSSRHLESP